MVYYQDEQKPPSVCAMIDACHDNGTKQSAYDLLLNNFLRHYLTNRAPFPMFMHAGWFTANPYRWEALNDFIDTVLAQPDVFFVTATDVIEWMKNPVQCEEGVNHEQKRTCKLEGLNDWSCKSKRVLSRSEVCPETQLKVVFCPVSFTITLVSDDSQLASDAQVLTLGWETPTATCLTTWMFLFHLRSDLFGLRLVEFASSSPKRK